MTDELAKTDTSPPADDGVLLFETSPYGNIDAIVQHDGRTVYFYLNESPTNETPVSESQKNHQPPKFGTRALWVRNLQTGPYVINTDDMQLGAAPMLPRTHCKSPHPSPLPRSERLKIVWFEEGNGAALLEVTDDDVFQTIAVIPPWSGADGFWGYAAECAAESELCWPLPDNPNLQNRIDRAEAFWNSFADSPDPFAEWQPQLLACYQQHFFSEASLKKTLDSSDDAANRSRIDAATTVTESIDDSAVMQYFSIDGNKFPPRGLVHLKTETHHILMTVAMSLCPQPNVEMYTETPSHFRRIELAIQLPLATSDAAIESISKKISRLAAYPWQQINWLGHGHTVQFSGLIPNVETATLISDRQLNPENPIPLPSCRGDLVNLLWIAVD